MLLLDVHFCKDAGIRFGDDATAAKCSQLKPTSTFLTNGTI